MDAQPAQRANVVRRISSRVCTGLTLLRQECYWLADVQDLQEDYKDRWSGPSNVVNRRLDWRQRFGTGGDVRCEKWSLPYALCERLAKPAVGLGRVPGGVALSEIRTEIAVLEEQRSGYALHLTPVESWERQRSGPTYVPEAFDDDGFVHTTVGAGPLLDVANAFYVSDARPYIALILDLSAIRAETRHDDASGLYPHIYGPINVDAVAGYLIARRGTDGKFLSFEHPG